MPINFPGSPSVNTVHSDGGRSWTWNGTSWVLNTYVGVVPPGAVGATQLAANAAVNNLGFTPASTGKSIAMSIVFGG